LTDEDGKYCFTATKGLWLIVPEISPEEKKQGFMFHQEELRAFITDSGILSLSFLSSNLEISGKVQCIKKNDCVGLTVKLT